MYGTEQSVPYDDIETRYRTKILSMLDYKKFPDIIHDLIRELPADAATWQSREERIIVHKNNIISNSDSL